MSIICCSNFFTVLCWYAKRCRVLRSSRMFSLMWSCSGLERRPTAVKTAVQDPNQPDPQPQGNLRQNSLSLHSPPSVCIDTGQGARRTLLVFLGRRDSLKPILIKDYLMC